MSNDEPLIWLGISQKIGECLLSQFNVPINTMINQISFIGKNGLTAVKDIQMTISGSNNWTDIKVPIILLPGDYQLKLAVEPTETSEQIFGIIVTIDKSTRVDNYQIYQAICGLTRSLGYHPSQILEQPNKNNTDIQPLHRKIRSDMKKEIIPLINGIQHQVQDLSSSVQKIGLSDKEKSVDIIIKDNPEHLAEIENLKALLNDKITEDKDCTEHLSEIENLKLLLRNAQSQLDNPKTSLNQRIKNLEKTNKELIEKLTESEDYIEKQNIILKQMGVKFA